jgi:DNA-binding NarL/FixJ family response regulator
MPLHWSYSLETHEWLQVNDYTLTNREKEILSLAARGYSTTEIAKRLFVCESTIKFHKQKMFQKLQVKTIFEALTVAYMYKIL